jgi:hypothetical protein
MSTQFRLALSLAFSLIFSLSLLGQVKAKEGLLDARSFNFSSSRLALNGEWLWVDGRLVSPTEIEKERLARVEFPKIWNEVRMAGIGQGTATYVLTVLLPSGTKDYAIELPQMYSSYNLWSHNELVASNGKAGTTLEMAQPQWLPQTISIEATDTLKLVLQISNFHHQKGGCKEPIYLGDRNKLLEKESTTKTSKIIECSALFILALTFLVLFALGKRKKVIVYFALLCGTWALRSAFSNEYLAIQLMPDFNWASMVRIEYITLYLTMIWAILFLSRLFTNESNQIIKYILVILNIVFVVFTILTPPVLFTKMLALYLGTSGMLLVYGILIVIRAYINERIGSTFLTICSLLGIMLFSYDIFTYEGIFSFNSILFSVGYIVMFAFMSVALLLHLNIIKTSKESSGNLSYRDLYGDRSK